LGLHLPVDPPSEVQLRHWFPLKSDVLRARLGVVIPGPIVWKFTGVSQSDKREGKQKSPDAKSIHIQSHTTLVDFSQYALRMHG
jgi:hypothetical protein